MPSIRSLSTFALSSLGTAQALFKSRDDGPAGSMVSCSNPQLSCHNSSVVENLCCFNAPGGALLQTQFWDTNPQTGPVDSWTIHGLWPDNCDGTYDASCDDSRAYRNITQILQAAGQDELLDYMRTYWPDYHGNNENFWEHEWSKHGTCISTIDPKCYTDYYPTEEVPGFFNKVVELFKTLPSYEWLAAEGIVPSNTATYTLSAIQSALSKNHGGHQVYLGCQRGALTEIWYFYNVKGSLISGVFEPSDVLGSSGSCPSSGIKYLPKTATSPSPTATTSTSAGPTPTGGHGPFSGSGFLSVVTSGSQRGCIISAGAWYTTGTCATIQATQSDDGFTLSSSKGQCGIVDGALTCGSSVPATVFTADGSSLAYDGQTTFYADGVPSGSTKGTVYTSSSHPTSLSITWSGK